MSDAEKRIKEINEAIAMSEAQKNTLENRLDRLSDIPRSTAMEVADLRSDLKTIDEDIEKLMAERSTLSGGN